LHKAADHRDNQRRAFLDHAGFAGHHPEPLRQDASFRRYFRICRDDICWLLMDAPPETENLQKWLQIGTHLNNLGFRVPHVLATDIDHGFALIEDFGADTFTRLLDQGEPPSALYAPAIDLLVALHQNPESPSIDVPPYDLKTLLIEAHLLPEWFLPMHMGAATSTAVHQEYEQAWLAVFSQLPAPANTLVLRDFHVDNLMRLTADKPLRRIGLLDFQDALVGPVAYDLLSLLEDARRDLPFALCDEMRQRYISAMPLLDVDNFSAWYTALAAQRHCKVLGIFSRLALRDQKTHYLIHLDRVRGLLNRHLDAPLLEPLKRWLQDYFEPAVLHAPPTLETTRAVLGLSDP